MCPDCDEPLVIYELDGVEIDHCLSCAGTWLDGGELELLLELSGTPRGELAGMLGAARGGRRDARPCPRCRHRMEAVSLDVTPPVEIDRCPIGHGFWLDRGEVIHLLEAFRERSDRRPEARNECLVAKFFGDLYRHSLENTQGRP